MTKKIAALVLFSSVLSVSASAAQFNGNLCETDIANDCLGVQGLGRAEVVQCLREHFSDLSSDCKAVMGNQNLKEKAPEIANGSGQTG